MAAVATLWRGSSLRFYEKAKIVKFTFRPLARLPVVVCFPSPSCFYPRSFVLGCAGPQPGRGQCWAATRTRAKVRSAAEPESWFFSAFQRIRMDGGFANSLCGFYPLVVEVPETRLHTAVGTVGRRWLTQCVGLTVDAEFLVLPTEGPTRH